MQFLTIFLPIKKFVTEKKKCKERVKPSNGFVDNTF